jgi:hypothetical protein
VAENPRPLRLFGPQSDQEHSVTGIVRLDEAQQLFIQLAEEALSSSSGKKAGYDQD